MLQALTNVQSLLQWALQALRGVLQAFGALTNVQSLLQWALLALRGVLQAFGALTNVQSLLQWGLQALLRVLQALEAAPSAPALHMLHCICRSCLHLGILGHRSSRVSLLHNSHPLLERSCTQLHNHSFLGP